MTTVAPEEVEESTLAEPTPAEAAPASLYEYAEWAHAGSEAAFCEHGEDGECENPGHFHAWCRIANDFQEREVREKALAAKARKIRQLRTPETDGNEILEATLESLRAEPDWPDLAAKEIVGYDWAEDYLAAVRQVKELEDQDAQPEEGEDELPKLFEHIEDDQAQFARLQAQSAEDRSQDEFTELEEHLKRYEEELRKAYEAITSPKEQTYEAMAENDLFDLLRRRRIEMHGRDEFIHARNIYTWLSCSYTNVDGDPVFPDLSTLEKAPDSVLAALRSAHNHLSSLAQGALGNS